MVQFQSKLTKVSQQIGLRWKGSRQAVHVKPQGFYHERQGKRVKKLSNTQEYLVIITQLTEARQVANLGWKCAGKTHLSQVKKCYSISEYTRVRGRAFNNTEKSHEIYILNAVSKPSSDGNVPIMFGFCFMESESARNERNDD